MVNTGSLITDKDISSLLYKVNQIACFLMCMWVAIPYFRVRLGVVFLLLMFGVWLLTTDLKWLTRKLTLDLIFVLLFFITFIPYIITGNLQYGLSGPNVIIVNFSIFFVGIFINHYYMYYKRDYVVVGRIALFSLVFFTVGSTQTYLGLLEYPLASRELAAGSTVSLENSSVYSQLGIGGFGHIYSASFLLIAILYLIFKKNPGFTMKYRILVFISITSIFLMLIQASYAISLIIVILGLLLVLFAKNKITFISLLIVGVCLLLLIPQSLIGEWLLVIADIFSANEILNQKFTDLAFGFLNNAASGQTAGRLSLYLISLQTFLDNPFFGIYGPFGNPFSGAVGGHSGWLDLLGFYGLFTVIPLLFIFYFNFKKHAGFYRKCNFHGTIITVYFLVLIFGTLNPILYVYEIGFVLFCVIPGIPFIAYAFNKRELGPNLH
ncbi:hypothetical protein [Bacillus thermotolerans]|uniref:O-antigen ligase family protein n=1 Tax=Bacillus thermotolerans TaxID=1221996 RepID=A0A0F5I5T8_BACTR|nr:hypothetical protein [Bacillus thermotolerans]KKB40906.1 hypothetical protein QY95_00969 [Bacillus thermotolerans]